MPDVKKTAFLCAGGTGGHLFPAEALAGELRTRGWSVHLVTDDRAQKYAASFPADAVHAVKSATFGGKNPIALAKAFFAIWSGFRQSGALIRKVKPDVVVGFGGYPTLPPVLAATMQRKPTLIHEQNAVMGRANRALGGRVNAIAGGFLSADKSAFPAKTVTTGNPVRAVVIAASGTDYAPPRGDDPFRLVVFGGSQGAQFFSEALPAAIAALDEKDRKRLVVTQQARAEDEAQVREAYGKLGIAAEVAPFFTDLAARMAQAHFVISRSGASTVSEVAAIGRPALLVPYPHALDHDQAANAAALAAAGGADVMKQADLSVEALTGILHAALTQPERLATMAAAAKATGKPTATRLLADLAEAIAAGKTVTEFREGLAP